MTKNSRKPAKASLDNVKPLMEERAKLHLKKKQIEDKIKELDETLRPMLVGKGELYHSGFSFKVEEVPGRTTYDYKAMLEDGIDIEPYKKVGRPSSRFTIKEVTEV